MSTLEGYTPGVSLRSLIGRSATPWTHPGRIPPAPGGCIPPTADWSPSSLLAHASARIDALPNSPLNKKAYVALGR